MRTKEACIKDLQFNILSYNEYWEDPIRDSVLWQFTDEVCRLIKSYLDIIEVQGIPMKKNYEKYSINTKHAISEIIRMVNDGRNLRERVEYFNFKKDHFNNEAKSRFYDHNVEDNGYLRFENDPFSKIERVRELCDELLEIINSEEKTSKLSKYLGRIFFFEGYENGSFIVRLNKIGFTDEDGFVFDGEVIEFVTPNSRYGYADGVVFYDAENMPFHKIPYYREEIETEEELEEYLANVEEYSEEMMKEAVAENIRFCFENTFNIYEE